MIVEGLARWLDSRVPLAKFVRKALNHVFPDHWSFMLGEIALYSFVILVITGTYMVMFFHGSSEKVIYHGTYRPLDGVQVSAAYQSVLHLSFDVPAGLLIRQMHHWAADIFIGAIVAHLVRLFFTAAYRRPRELNWMVGVTLLILALANGYFGYSICGDLLSGAGLRIGYAIMLSIPIIGPWITFLALGGTVPVAATVPRLYALHIFLVPALIALLIGVHLAIIWRQLHTNFPGPRRTDKTIVGARLWPSYTLKSLGLFLLLFAIIAAMGGLLQIDPVWIYGPYNPIAILPGAQPDWYLGWVEGAMRLFPGVNLRLGSYLVPEVFFPGFLFPFLVFVFLYAWPFLEKFLSFDFRLHHVLRVPRQQPWITAFGCAVLAMMVVLQFAGGDDVVAIAEHASVTQIRTLLRILFFVAPAVTFFVAYLLCRLASRRFPVPSEQRTAEEILEREAAPQPQ